MSDLKKFYPLTVSSVVKETEDCVSVSFDVPDSQAELFTFEPGQYLTIKKEINGEEIRRSYSICTAPHENNLKVAVKKVEGGRFSTFANELLKEGDTLECMPPDGRFVLPGSFEKGKYVFYAAGSGITPVIAIIKHLLNDSSENEVILFYGNRRSDNVIFKEELEDLKDEHLQKFSLHYIMSKEFLSAPAFCGRIDAEKCSLFGKLFYDVKAINNFFICGPEEMIMTVKDCLEKDGTDPAAIKFELFTTPGAKENKAVKESSNKEKILCDITIQMDGNEFDFELYSDSDSILDAALHGGADLPFACKGGVCCTCKAKLESGEVEMEVNYGLEQEEIDAGYILTCQSHPTTKKVKVNFDA